ncbi:MAG: HAD family hydrolase [Alphaproteobacteria bacterium]|nr:HAD family hydrolase [Alphaproteobacteria bacterium]
MSEGPGTGLEIRAAFFDIDGTLVDSNEFHVAAWAEAISSAGLTVARRDIRTQIGKGADLLLPALVPHIDSKERKALAEAHGNIFHERFLKLVKPFPGASELIARLHRVGVQIVVASSSAKTEVEHYVGLLDIERRLAGTISFDDVDASKPEPDLFAAALRKVKPIAADQSVAIGDTPYDIAAAAKCGVRTIALRSGGFSDAELEAEKPLSLYTDIRALLAAFPFRGPGTPP